MSRLWIVFSMVFLTALPALSADAVRSVVSISSVGEVTLSCARPGGWTFSLDTSRQEDGVEIVTVRMKAPKPEAPPTFDLSWLASQRDAHHFWSSGSVHYGIPWSHVYVSDISSEMPLYAYLDASDHNRFTFACSESRRRVEFRSPIVEKKMAFAGSYRFFTSPEAPLSDYEVSVRFDSRDVFYGESIAEASDWMCRGGGFKPLEAPKGAFDPLYSSWYTFHQEVSAALVEEECALAAPMGMKTVILDDGWQIDMPLEHRNGMGYRLCGDWQAGRNFPDMAAHVKRVHELGFKYMVWYSVPFVGENSANFARFKDKLLPNSCAGGHVMDPRFPEVREFLVSTYEKALEDWDLDGFKLDFIDRFTLQPGVKDPAVAQNYAGRDIKSIPLAVDRLMTDITARLKAKKPDILIEFRQRYVGPCIRRFGNMLRASDCPCSMVENRTRTARLRLTSGNTAVHSDMLQWRNDETAESAARAILNALFSVVQYSVRLKTLPPDHLKMMRHWIAFSQRHRDALLKGRFRAHMPAADYPLLEGESAAERVWGVYDRGIVVPTGTMDRPVFIVNGANADSLAVEFASPASVERFDTFGKSFGTEEVSAGLHRVAVPVSGYLKVVGK